MKKILIVSIALLVSFVGFSQDIEEINEMLSKNNFKDAKAAIDKYLQNPKKANDAEGWFTKGQVYNVLSKDAGISNSESSSLKDEAFVAFKKYQELDQKNLLMILNNYESYLDLYVEYGNLGIKSFNQKSFDEALTYFKKSAVLKDYIVSKNYQYTQYPVYAVDTNLILNTAAAAIQANKPDEAAENYQKLADIGISGEDYKDVYIYLVSHYSSKPDVTALKNIKSKALNIYPDNDLWLQVELEALSKKGDTAQLYIRYEELIAENPTNFMLVYNYSVQLYNKLYGRNAAEVKDPVVSDKLTETLKKAIAAEKADDISATVLMSNHLFNKSSDVLNAANAVKGNKPEDVKKRNDFKATANKQMDECILYSDKAVKFYEAIPSRTPAQNANFKIVLSYLIDIYNVKKNPAKVAEYEKKNALADR